MVSGVEALRTERPGAGQRLAADQHLLAGAGGVQHNARLHGAGGQRTADMVMTTGKHGRAGRQAAAGGSRRCHLTHLCAGGNRRRQNVRRDTGVRQQLPRPCAGGRVQQQGAGSQRQIHGGRTGEAEGDIIGDAVPAAHLPEHPRLVLL